MIYLKKYHKEPPEKCAKYFNPAIECVDAGEREGARDALMVASEVNEQELDLVSASANYLAAEHCYHQALRERKSTGNSIKYRNEIEWWKEYHGEFKKKLTDTIDIVEESAGQRSNMATNKDHTSNHVLRKHVCEHA
ncbi:hypothetical protein RF11_15063 [Thelohanellus kitauei]|uniref:Uncharacterized protein n=1 Tax=Thelohanellus kitauei TaxID=669202 RepID=A0A0C2MQA8_THEKT|nr:hypothetical protein RF11_15063 [Thelohanellus kitauei]